MVKYKFCIGGIVLLLNAGWAGGAWAFDSGSSGADGAFNPNVDTELALPEDGIFEFTDLTIPEGVTVTFAPNALNTPVTLLVAGDAVIDGVLDVSGADAAPSVGAGDGNVGDDGLPGAGGPGGFAGGRGGPPSPDSSANGPRMAQSGLGPGGGIAATQDLNDYWCWGSGGSFATQGNIRSSCWERVFADTYGNADLLPLIGGSGGSGGFGGAGTGGSGGGGGGGALLLAASGTLTVNGAIRADGGYGGDLGTSYQDMQFGRVGGGGSGGAIRLVASTVDGTGDLSALGADGGDFADYGSRNWNSGGAGRIRIEAEALLFTETTSPAFTTGEPGELFVAGLPTLRIASVAGQPAPAEPTGTADIVLSSEDANPVEVGFEASGVPLGNTLTLVLTPPAGEPVRVISTALAGSVDASTATALVDIPDGGSTLLALLSFAVVEAQAQVAWSRFTRGERVHRVELVADASGRARTRLHTETGRVVVVDAPAG